MSKAYAGESTIAFTQSAAAAYGYTLLSVRGNVVAQSLGFTPVYTKLHAGTLIVAVSMWNAESANTTTANASYALRGTTSFLSSGLYYYVAVTFSASGLAAGEQNAEISAGGSRPLWIAEIGQ